MKKIYLLGLALIFCYAATAQISISPKLGVNFNKINYGEDLNDRFNNLSEPWHVGLQAGLGFDFMISDDFSMYTELLYTQKGSQYEGDQGGFYVPLLGEVSGDIEKDLTLSYLELPVMARLKFGDITQFYLNAGGYAGYWIGGNIETQYQLTNDDSRNVEQDIVFEDEMPASSDDYVILNDNVRRLDYGISIGTGVLFGLNSGKFNLDLRYNIGLNSIYENEDDPDKTWKNNSLSISIGYFFNMADQLQEM